MGQAIFDSLRSLITQHGYWAVGGFLFLENMGLPVPGETMLLLASFMAYSQHELELGYIILIGVCAATVGDNEPLAVSLAETVIAKSMDAPWPWQLCRPQELDPIRRAWIKPIAPLILRHCSANDKSRLGRGQRLDNCRPPSTM